MQFLTSRQSRELDKIATSNFGIQGKTLMGNAGNQIANTVLKFYPDTEKYKILIRVKKSLKLYYVWTKLFKKNGQTHIKKF